MCRWSNSEREIFCYERYELIPISKNGKLIRTESYSSREVALFQKQGLAWRHDMWHVGQDSEPSFRISRHWTITEFAARVRETFFEGYELAR